VTLGGLDRETEVFGLATPTGLVSQTGIAGLTLGGGLGWLSRLHGPTCDNLSSAQVVLAGGDVVTAGEGEHTDLLWGLRGGGGNFGIVTSFVYRLHALGPVLAGPVFHRGEDAVEVMRFYREFVANAPDELTVLASFFVAPDAPFLPAEAHGRPVVALAVCYAGDLDEGERLLRPLRAFGRPLADLVAPMPFSALQRASDAGYPPGQRNYWKSSYLDAISDEAIETAVEGARRMTSALSSFYFQPLGGAIARGSDADSAFGHRDAAFDFAILTVWRDPAESAEHIAWTRELWEAMLPFAGNRVYVNNLGEEGPERVRAAYAPAIYERLVGLKDRYDPDNTFRLNQNIVPSGWDVLSPA
jgi:FAD/FMN-containing dehydrogenase